MPNIAEYLTDLLRQKNKLVDNLVSKGVEADYNERLNTLVPKVLDIKGGGEDMAVLYPVEISLDTTVIKITDTSNGLFGDGYIIYSNGSQLYKFASNEDVVYVNLLDLEFPYIGDFTINAVIYDIDNFKNSGISNSILYRMPGYYIENIIECYFQSDYEISISPWNTQAEIAKLI